MNTPQVGDVWVRNGRRREVEDVYTRKDGAVMVQYGRRHVLLGSWMAWARNAGLVWRDGKQVQS